MFDYSTDSSKRDIAGKIDIFFGKRNATTVPNLAHRFNIGIFRVYPHKRLGDERPHFPIWSQAIVEGFLLVRPDVHWQAEGDCLAKDYFTLIDIGGI